jgi:hypothetical protein
MPLLADIALTGVVAGAGALAFVLCRRSWRLLAIVVAPLAAAGAAFPLPLVALAFVFQGAGMGASGHSPTEALIVKTALLLLCGASAAGAGIHVARLVDARAAVDHPPAGRPAGLTPTWLWGRRVLPVLTLLLLAPVVWREHRFWRAYEVVARGLDLSARYARTDAMHRLASLRDRRALPLLSRLARTQGAALRALPALGADGDLVLAELIQAASSSEQLVDALTALCRPSVYGPGVARVERAYEVIAPLRQHDDPGVREAAAACPADPAARRP